MCGLETFPVTHLTQHPGLVTYTYRMLALWYLTPVASCEVWVTAQCAGEEETERCYLPVFPGAGGRGGSEEKDRLQRPKAVLETLPLLTTDGLGPYFLQGCDWAGMGTH